MRTIVEPKEYIDKLWGKQRIREAATYRLMKYVLRVDHDGMVLLHNVVTGRLVVLDELETVAVDMLPKSYSSEMEQLATEHYLVPEEYDEHQLVVNLRNILWKIVDARAPKEVNSYLIFPTTDCNARCWYCFQKGVKTATMTEETANDVVAFIEKNCGGKPVRLWWFGGEPTLANNRIDQICEGLRRKRIKFFSDITTNGYLFDDDMAERAKNLWNLRQASFSLDGTEATYNRVKSFVNVQDNPYQRMMHNAELLLGKGIAVALRMNYDQDSYLDFANLLMEAKAKFPKDVPLMVYPRQINREYPETESSKMEAWFNDKNLELTDMACAAGLYQRKERELPSLSYQMCGAANGNWYVITPTGDLVCCGEQIGNDQIKGNLREGINKTALEEKWKQFADYEKCKLCTLFPVCVRMLYCAAKDRCYSKKKTISQYTKIIRLKASKLS